MGPGGQILLMTEVNKLPVAQKKKYIPIPNEDLAEVERMNRADRRKWYRENKKKRSWQTPNPST